MTWVVRARPLLGTFVEIGVSAPESMGIPSAIDRAFDTVAQVHALMSYQSQDSDVTRINREAARRPVTVHARTWEVLAAAQAMARASEGLFDITVAPTLGRFGLLPRHPGLPRACRTARWQHVELLSRQRVRFSQSLRVDLSGIAKGYAVDLAIEALRQAGVTSGCVNAGGDLRTFGDVAPTIHVRRLDAPTATLPLVVLRDEACATSAAYFSTRRHQGRRVCALIHPLTRAPCKLERSVTVLAANCMTADALTKVVHSDPARAPSVLAHYGARAMMIERDDQTGAMAFFESSPSLYGWNRR